MRGCYGLLRTLRTWAEYLPTPWQRESTAIMDCQSIDSLYDLNAICCIFLLNNPRYIIEGNCWVGTVIHSMHTRPFGPCSVTLSSWWHGWCAMRTGVNISVLNRLILTFKAPLLFWLICVYCMSAWTYRVTTKYSYFINLITSLPIMYLLFLIKLCYEYKQFVHFDGT